MPEKSSPMSSLFETIKNDPATKQLMQNAGDYAKARVAGGVKSATKGKGSGPATSDKDKDDAPDTAASGAASQIADSVAEGDSPMKMIGKGVKGAVKGAVKKKGGQNKRPTNITDEFWIGLPATSVYNQWTQYKEFPGFMKGPIKADVEDDYTESNWSGKIFLNTRSWKAKTVEMIPDQRIKWKTEGPKGTIDGCVTFHEVADRLTLMIFVLEYRPKGFFEWWGNRWRTVGRRYRLDVKHFRRFLMMNGEETGAWRGRIEDGELVESDEDAQAREDQESGDQEEGSPQPDHQDEDSDSSDDESEDEDQGDKELTHSSMQAAGDSWDKEPEPEQQKKPRREPRGRKRV